MDETEQLEKIIASSRMTAQGRPHRSQSINHQSSISYHGFTALDHVAVVVPDTEEALEIWRDRMGLRLLYSEVVNEGAVRLTHLDLGNTQLQLVEPLAANHPLKSWLATNVSGLHHICFSVESVGEIQRRLPKRGLSVAPRIHQGTQGRRALFLDGAVTHGVQVEVAGR